MGNLIEMPDKKIHTILDTDDLLELVEDYMGPEVREAIVEAMNEQDDCMKDLEYQCVELTKNHREIMQQIYDEQLALHDLIIAEELDRKAISKVCGRLSSITSRELNRN